MKTPQRRFVVEHKSGRRQSKAGTTSIWGNTDLKALLDEAEDEMPFVNGSKAASAPGVIPDVTMIRKHAAVIGSADTVGETASSSLNLGGSDVAGVEPEAKPVLTANKSRTRRPKVRAAIESRGQTLRRDRVDLASAQANDDLSVLSIENQRLKRLLAQQLHLENQQLRRMLERF